MLGQSFCHRSDVQDLGVRSHSVSLLRSVFNIDQSHVTQPAPSTSTAQVDSAGRDQRSLWRRCVEKWTSMHIDALRPSANMLSPMMASPTHPRLDLRPMGSSPWHHSSITATHLCPESLENMLKASDSIVIPLGTLKAKAYGRIFLGTKS